MVDTKKTSNGGHLKSRRWPAGRLRHQEKVNQGSPDSHGFPLLTTAKGPGSHQSKKSSSPPSPSHQVLGGVSGRLDGQNYSNYRGPSQMPDDDFRVDPILFFPEGLSTNLPRHPAQNALHISPGTTEILQQAQFYGDNFTHEYPPNFLETRPANSPCGLQISMNNQDSFLEQSVVYTPVPDGVFVHDEHVDEMAMSNIDIEEIIRDPTTGQYSWAPSPTPSSCSSSSSDSQTSQPSVMDIFRRPAEY